MKGSSRSVREELEKPPSGLGLSRAEPEVMGRIEIEIRPESPISATWRLVAVRDPRGRWLRDKGRLYGGTMRQAHQDALRVAAENAFIYKAPPGMGIGP